MTPAEPRAEPTDVEALLEQAGKDAKWLERYADDLPTLGEDDDEINDIADRLAALVAELRAAHERAEQNDADARSWRAMFAFATGAPDVEIKELMAAIQRAARQAPGGDGT